MAMPAVTEPPGLLMYIQMSLPGSSASRNRSCAQIWLAMSSLTSVPNMMMRLLSNRLKISVWALKPEVSSAKGGVSSDMGARLAVPFPARSEHSRRRNLSARRR